MKMAVPKRVAEHDIRSAVRAMLIGSVEKTAEVGLNAQSVEEVPAHLVQPGAGLISAGVQSCLLHGVSDEIHKAAVAIAEVEVVRIRLEADAFPVDSPQALLLRQIQRAQDQSVQYTEHHGVCANGQGQGRDGGDGES